MLAALLLAACSWIPSYPHTLDADPECTPANQAIECRCSECFSWTPGVVDLTHAPATMYRITRTSQDGTVRAVTFNSHSYVDDNGATQVIPARTTYCPARDDDAMPIEGRVYRYTVAAGNADGWSAESPVIVEVAAPYAIDAGVRQMVKGN